MLHGRMTYYLMELYGLLSKAVYGCSTDLYQTEAASQSNTPRLD